jgi:hypothetical protein
MPVRLAHLTILSFIYFYFWQPSLMVAAFACRIQEHHEENLMTARNLGVVFGRMYAARSHFYVLTRRPPQQR